MLVLSAVSAVLLAVPASAKRVVRPFSPVEKLVLAETVVIGKVTAIEKDTVNTAPAPGAEKVAHQIAVIKVESGLVGAANVTHIKVGFVPPARGEPPAIGPGRFGGGFGPVVLTEGLEGLFYLTRHHTGEFYTAPAMLTPATTGDAGYKGEVAFVKKAAVVLADPVKALKADKADARAFAAAVLARKYGSYPISGGAFETEKVSREESALILKALAEGDWTIDPTDVNELNGYRTFGQLRLTDADGWKPPVVKAGENHVEKTKEAFVAWLAGPGKDHQVRKFVPKKK
ncbi:MAG: hypothetical protein J0I06_24875 [Planctomycetes bacterium]|nr:hypothetical protein [Planctomycetota bacterium]